MCVICPAKLSTYCCDGLLFDQVCSCSTSQIQDFKRDIGYSNLLNLITSPNDPGINSQMLTELESSDEELPECVDDPYDLPKNDDEWIDTISSIRKNDKMTAIQNIKKNQKVQKKTYDSKVKRNR